MTLRALHVIASCACVAAMLAAAPVFAQDPIAQCIAANERSVSLRKQSMLVEAREESAKCATSNCPDEIRAACTERISDIANVMPSIVFAVRDASGADVTDVNVEVDSKPIGKLGLAPLPLNPGSHTLRFTTGVGGRAEKTLLLREGERNRQERIVLSAPERPSVTPPPTVPVVDETHLEPAPISKPSAPGTGQRIAGIVVGVVGLGGIGLGSVFGGLAISKWNAAKSDCGTGCPSDDPAQREKMTASTDALVSTVALIVGGVAVAGGIALFVTAPKKAAVNSAWLGVIPQLGGAAIGGRF